MIAEQFRGRSFDRAVSIIAHNIVAMPRVTPPNYQTKFADFIRLCRKSQADGVQQVVIASPSIIGDNYEEIIESLSRLAEAGLGLQIAGPETRSPGAPAEIGRN
ncbi:MAG: hypothetical protein WC378_11565 [Opitutaceae bacterium]